MEPCEEVSPFVLIHCHDLPTLLQADESALDLLFDSINLALIKSRFFGDVGWHRHVLKEAD